MMTKTNPFIIRYNLSCEHFQQHSKIADQQKHNKDKKASTDGLRGNTLDNNSS